ncbi:ankyrin repeat and LEM domain-containing protein 2 [Esox lucius]|uniref:ankyrin repeat and LEM domain-containing protein 2 n=1 Tax=Esox lucius TaxID=8010 RepID=UPI0014774384|nr:ankyrin repeat and LEM domain-containing protein 2 [Esox lucius]XP_010897239.2 ankyrin repeat and LEM domain-containing protein 2 [Esox lucius]XP_010897240.2 ankyrin repeat and LEM domain-containing protein 2 [Esox lucius]XP_010897241.2 ankyrin repeat and LEM domain-containing protein 2 [Esox lucius]XP_010897242.2 ankyrin repeat and LEM domain-containing protein 2 [Esox lucius]XP_010897243.2 ankyrin repeat and LEM domain-containing protein 2 [Esox lucius]XP_019908616.2 ankyrin repeat and L
MEEAMSRLQTLSPDQLRQEIIGAGLKCGPLTATTRAIFERKLARALLEKQGGNEGVSGGAGSSNVENDGLLKDRAEAEHSQDLKLSEEGGKETEKLDQPQDPLVYYGVCPHWEEPVVTDDKVHVFVDRKKALKAMMTMNGSRFKAFSTREEAEKFSKGFSEHSPASASPTPVVPQGMLEPVVHTDSPTAGVDSPVNLERPNEFRSPRTQDLTAKLRKAVEEGDKEAFSKLVWANPRYLIGSGDNPTIVHEGCHYNVLHVAAKENQPGMVQLLLDTLESPDFMRLMYPEDQETMLRQRIRYLVDLYLNTPDKASNETPLHFACKFGHPDVVNVLCSHPATDKHRQNKYNQKPSSVICERKNKSPDIKKKIKEYLEERYYVPLLRDTDNSFQPVIGLPWSPSSLEADFHLLGSGAVGSPIDPIMTVRAYVGPLSPSKAHEFHRLWKTPPRDRAEYFHRILKSDPDRGAERVGREIAHDRGHPWVEYWDFLGSFIDLSTEDGLRRLEDYLNRKDQKECGRSEGSSVGFKTVKPSKQEQNQSHILTNHILNDTSKSPVCNLLSEFEKANLQGGHVHAEYQKNLESVEGRVDPSSPRKDCLSLGNSSFWRTWEWSHSKRQVEELSSSSSEEYLTADEGSDSEGPGGSIDGADWRRERRSSGSSSTSYKSTEGDTSKDTILMTDTPQSQKQGLFMDGESPTKLDSEVFAALNHVDIDPETHPCITKWRKTILAYPASKRLSWPSPTRRKSSTGTPNCTPSRLSVHSPGCHTPVQSCYTENILYQTLFRSPN